jgi:hypothetical protein
VPEWKKLSLPTWALWTGLACWAALWAVVMSRHGGVSWHYFDRAGLALVDLDDPTGSLHVYATHPDLQFGPVAMAAAAVLSLLGARAGMVTAQFLAAGAGLLLLALAGQVAAHVQPLGSQRRQSQTLALAGVAFLPVWMNLAVRFVHIDDVLALLLVVAAVLAAVNRMDLLAAVLLGLSVAAKPWAIPFLALLLAVPARHRGRAAAVALGVVAAGWLPFLVADPRSALASRFAIPSAAGSGLRTLGVNAAVTPVWDRPLQMALGLVLAVVAVRRGRWPAVVLVVVCVRIALDPGTYSYYTGGIVVGALLWDLVGVRRLVPAWTLAAALALFAARWLPVGAPALGWVRMLFVMAVLALLVLPPRRRRLPHPRAVLKLPVRQAH